MSQKRTEQISRHVAERAERSDRSLETAEIGSLRGFRYAKENVEFTGSGTCSRIALAVCVAAMTAFCLAAAGCKSPMKTAGKAAATTTVKGAKTGAKATVSGAQTVGGAAAGAVTRDRGR